jgi:dTDP-4-amino-4,6-dideoxygalactose transaminase
MNVPLVDLRAQYATIRHEVEPAIHAVLERADFILGSAVERFERAFAAWIGVPYAWGVANGTDAVEISLRAAGIRPGDDVLVPANTFVASAIGVVRAGARPVYVDCTEQFLMDLGAASKAVTARTRAVLAVHLCGRLFEPDALREFARSHHLIVVEDAAQAHGARSTSGRAGAIGVSASWSFYPGKNLGAYGDGGAVTTTDAVVAQRIVAFRNYGSSSKYEHPEFGVNSRLDTLQAAVLEVKLGHIDAWNAARRRAATKYVARLRGVPGVVVPEVPPGDEHVWHLFMVRIPSRDQVLMRLHQAGVGAGIHYPTPLPFLTAIPTDARPGDFPVAERLAREILSLPLYPEITDEQIDYVCDQLRRALVVTGV